MSTQTSLESYKRGVVSGDFADQRSKILKHLIGVNRPLSYDEISRNMQIRIQSVCGRMGELLAMGIVEECPNGIKWDNSSHRNVKTWRVKI